MKKKLLLVSLIFISTLSFSKNPVNAFKELKSDKKEDALKSFLEINKKDSLSVIVNYGLALLYSDYNFSLYDLELSHKYSKNAKKYVDYNPNSKDDLFYSWNNLVNKSELKQVEKLKLEPKNIYRLNDSILNSIYQKAVKENTISGYNHFVNYYPEYYDINFVHLLINDLAFKDAIKKNTIEEYNYFINNYPNSTKIYEANQRINELIFSKVKEKNTIEAYNVYISHYPKALQIKEAKQKIAELAFNEAKQKNTTDDYEQFITKYPESTQFIQQAKEYLQEIRANILTFIELPQYDNVSEFSEGLAEVRVGAKFGLINKSGILVVPLQSKYSISNCHNGISIVDTYVNDETKSNIKYGCIDTVGNIIIPLIYDDLSDFHEDISIVESNNKFGLIDKTGKLRTQLRFDRLEYSYSHGTYSFELNNKKGLLDMNGNLLTQTLFDYINNDAPDNIFDNNLILVGLNHKYGCIDIQSGKIVIPLIYGSISSFHEGIAVVEPFRFDWATTKLYVENGCIDKDGKVVIPFQQYQIGNFSEGLASVSDGELKGFINITGEVVIPFKYIDVQDFNGGLAVVRSLIDESGNCGAINKMGKVVIPLKYNNIHLCKDGIIGVELNEKWGFLDRTGKELTPLIYDRISKTHDYCNGFTMTLNNKEGFIDNTGKILIPIQYDRINEFEDNVTIVSLNEKYGVINNYGKSLTKIEYDFITDFKKGVAVVRLNNKYGLIIKPFISISEPN